MENVRIEVVSYTKVILEIPDFTVTGIFQSVRVLPIDFRRNVPFHIAATRRAPNT